MLPEIILPYFEETTVSVFLPFATQNLKKCITPVLDSFTYRYKMFV